MSTHDSGLYYKTISRVFVLHGFLDYKVKVSLGAGSIIGQRDLDTVTSTCILQMMIVLHDQGIAGYTGIDLADIDRHVICPLDQ